MLHNLEGADPLQLEKSFHNSRYLKRSFTTLLFIPQVEAGIILLHYISLEEVLISTKHHKLVL